MSDGLRKNIARARAMARDGSFDHAAQAYGLAAQLARRFELAGELAFCLRHQAQCLFDSDCAQAALAPAQESLDIYTRIEPDRGPNYAESARLVARIKDALGKSGEAQNLWTELREIYDIHGSETSVEECDIRLTA
ncbi:MAG: hypothetical protein AAFY07_01600 [Pseudomonadota bacterium]